jgi:hypothetical protein
MPPHSLCLVRTRPFPKSLLLEISRLQRRPADVHQLDPTKPITPLISAPSPFPMLRGTFLMRIPQLLRTTSQTEW